MSKYILFVFLLTGFLSCKTIVKKQLPYEDNPKMITYKKDVEYSGSMESNYNNLVKKIFNLCPETKTVLEDKSNGYFQFISYSQYDYKGSARKFSFIITGTLKNSKCSLIMNGFHIMHYPIERIYFNDRRGNIKKFNESYADIDKRSNNILTTLSAELK
jgi:hypothetical protein